MARPKIFVIGLHKTGTTSLSMALKLLGYRVKEKNIAYPEAGIDRQRLFELAIAQADQFDAFRDDYWPILYREADKYYPGSKFILTVRATDLWLASAVYHFGTIDNRLRKLFYGASSPVGNEDIYRKRFDQHNQEIIDYFKDRPHDLLVLDVTAGDGWQQLCPFLNREIPKVDFPYVNKGDDREAAKTRVNTNITGADKLLALQRSDAHTPAVMQVMPVFYTRHLERSEAFYQSRLGFQTVFRYLPHLVVVEYQGIMIHLAFYDGAAPPPTQVEVLVKGVETLYEEFTRQQVVPDDGHLQTDWLTRQFSVADLDNNRIIFMELLLKL